MSRPTDHGARSDGSNNAVPGLEAAVDALPPQGGIVLFEPGTYVKDHQRWEVQRDHVLLWAPNGRATLHSVVDPRTSGCGTRAHATLFRETVGGGVYGLHFTSNADERHACGESHQISAYGVDGFEVLGVEISGSAGAGIFFYQASRNLYVEGNYIHHTHADSVHHTGGSRRSWVFGNHFFNEDPTRGDDGIACVTYALDAPRCGEMEWFENTYYGGTHGRGLAVIGGQDILIHHNWVMETSGAGVIVASESSYATPGSDRIRVLDNWLIHTPNEGSNGHSAILVSGNNLAAQPLRDIVCRGNVIIDPIENRVERAEGNYENVVFDNHTDASLLPGPRPELSAAAPRDTAVLRTRDVSFVDQRDRRGLYRIHVRETASGLQERFEYVVSGPDAALRSWLGSQGVCAAEIRDVSGVSYAQALSARPLATAAELTAVDFEAMRAGDRDGTLSWLWDRVDRVELE